MRKNELSLSNNVDSIKINMIIIRQNVIIFERLSIVNTLIKVSFHKNYKMLKDISLKILRAFEKYLVC